VESLSKRILVGASDEGAPHVENMVESPGRRAADFKTKSTNAI
jgi:hypothetical protein